MDKRLRRIADFLLAHPKDRPVNPTSIGAGSLPYVFVLDIEQGTKDSIRLRVRLTGTSFDGVFRRSLVGQYLDSFMHGPRSSDVLAGFLTCAQTHQTMWMRQVVALGNGLPRYVEGVVSFVAPNRLYGGMVTGETATHASPSSFESSVLEREAIAAA